MSFMNTPVPVVAGQPLCVDLRSRYEWGSTVCAVAAIASDTGYKKRKNVYTLTRISLVHPFSLAITVLSFFSKINFLLFSTTIKLFYILT